MPITDYEFVEKFPDGFVEMRPVAPKKPTTISMVAPIKYEGLKNRVLHPVLRSTKDD